VLDDLGCDDSDSPTIGLVGAGVSWDEVQDHLKIAHGPLLIEPGNGGEYAGAYWAGARMVVVPELGTDQQEALEEFRDVLRDRGQA
jgi:hypothetical protein